MQIPTPLAFTFGPCSLGTLLLAQSPCGICAIFLGCAAPPLAQALQRRFPRAVLTHEATRLAPALAQAVALVEHPGEIFDLPLDLRGTPYQQRVWQALRAIPPGRTASYTDIARQLGAPRSARAVAGACAANPVAVAVPCHRVLRHDGALSGYRWGVARKRELLRREHENLLTISV